MFRMVLALLSVGIAACGGPPAVSTRPRAVTHASASQIARKAVLPQSYIVAFRTPPEARDMLRFRSFGAEHNSHFALLAERFLGDPRVKDLQFLTALDLAPPDFDSPARAVQGPRRATAAVASVTRVDFTDEIGAKSLLDEWESSGELWYAEPNGISRLSQDPTQPTDPTQPGNSTPPPPPESLFAKQAASYESLNYWWLKSIGIVSAFQLIGQRDLNVSGTPTDTDMLAARPIVAVLDSGVDYEHPALKDRMWINSDIGAANCDNDYHGCNTTTVRRGRLGDGDVHPFGTTGPNQACGSDDSNCSHGTHVAGLVAADPSWSDPATGRAVGGMCPICQIMVLKIVSKIGNDSGILDSSIIAAFKYVALFRREGSPAVRVINASFGKFVRSRTVGLMIRLMREKRGALVIGAAGNEDLIDGVSGRFSRCRRRCRCRQQAAQGVVLELWPLGRHRRARLEPALDDAGRRARPEVRNLYGRAGGRRCRRAHGRPLS